MIFVDFHPCDPMIFVELIVEEELQAGDTEYIVYGQKAELLVRSTRRQPGGQPTGLSSCCSRQQPTGV